MEVETFARRLQRLRLASGKSQRALARAAGLSNGTISQAESGDIWGGQLPSLDVLRRLALVLDVPVEELAGEDVERLARDAETARLAEFGRAVLRLVRESARPTLAAVVDYHRRRLQREFSPELYATIEIAFAETEVAYERMIGPDPDASPDDPTTPALGREA